MNTSWKDFDTLISEFPEERETIKRLKERFDGDIARGASYPLNRMVDIARPSSDSALIYILKRMCDLGILSRIIRVESDAMGGIADFKSIDEIPLVIFDDRKGHNIEVRMDQLRVVYELREHIVHSI